MVSSVWFLVAGVDKDMGISKMALIERFEDIRGWQEARVLTRSIYQISGSGMFAKDFGLRDQIRRASVSIMANTAEGFDCDSHKEFARFLEIACRSAAEVQSLLYVALDVQYINQEQFKEHYDQAQKAKRILGAFRKSLRSRTQ